MLIFTTGRIKRVLSEADISVKSGSQRGSTEPGSPTSLRLEADLIFSGQEYTRLKQEFQSEHESEFDDIRMKLEEMLGQPYGDPPRSLSKTQVRNLLSALRDVHQGSYKDWRKKYKDEPPKEKHYTDRPRRGKIKKDSDRIVYELDSSDQLQEIVLFLNKMASDPDRILNLQNMLKQVYGTETYPSSVFFRQLEDQVNAGDQEVVDQSFPEDEIEALSMGQWVLLKSLVNRRRFIKSLKVFDRRYNDRDKTSKESRSALRKYAGAIRDLAGRVSASVVPTKTVQFSIIPDAETGHFIVRKFINSGGETSTIDTTEGPSGPIVARHQKGDPNCATAIVRAQASTYKKQGYERKKEEYREDDEVHELLKKTSKLFGSGFDQFVVDQHQKKLADKIKEEFAPMSEPWQLVFLGEHGDQIGRFKALYGRAEDRVYAIKAESSVALGNKFAELLEKELRGQDFSIARLADPLPNSRPNGFVFQTSLDGITDVAAGLDRLDDEEQPDIEIFLPGIKHMIATVVQDMLYDYEDTHGPSEEPIPEYEALQMDDRTRKIFRKWFSKRQRPFAIDHNMIKIEGGEIVAPIGANPQPEKEVDPELANNPEVQDLMAILRGEKKGEIQDFGQWELHRMFKDLQDASTDQEGNPINWAKVAQDLGLRKKTRDELEKEVQKTMDIGRSGPRPEYVSKPEEELEDLPESKIIDVIADHTPEHPSW